MSYSLFLRPFFLYSILLAALLVGGSVPADAQTSCELFPLSVPVPQANTYQGARTSVSGQFAIVGASSDAQGAQPGQALIYQYIGGVWVLQQVLSAPGQVIQDSYASHVYIDDHTALVAAYNYSRATPWGSEGIVYVYTRQGSQWVLTGSIANPNPSYRAFGWSLAKSGTDVVIGCNYTGTEKHAVYVFRQPVTPTQPWKLVATLTPWSGLGYDYGYSVAIQGDNLVVGAADSFNFGRSAAYFYHRSATGDWTLQQVEPYPDKTYVGSGVAVHGRYAAVGSDANRGVRIYERTSSGWQLVQTLVSPDNSVYRFGYSVALNASTLLIANQAGTVYRYAPHNGRWQFSRRYRPNPFQANDAFGAWVSLDELTNNLSIGAPNRTLNGQRYAGQAFVLWAPALQPAGPFCPSSPATVLQATATGGVWSGPGILHPSVGTFSPASAGPGVHTITYSLQTAGCQYQDTLRITVGEDTHVSRPARHIFSCQRDTVIQLQASPAGGRWQGTGVSATGQFHTAWAGPGRHSLVYLHSASTGCTPQDTVSLVVTPAPVRILSHPPALCRLDTTIALQASVAGGTWSASRGSMTAAGLFSAALAGPGQHLLRYRIGTGQCSAADSIVVTVRPLSVPVLQPTGPLVLRCGASSAELRLATAPTPGSTLQWQMAPSASGPWQPLAQATSTSWAATESGWYRMQATQGHCEALSIPVQVSVEPLPQQLIPNVFTPNDDHLNDVFEIRLPYVRTFQLQVFDRWGRQVFVSRRYGDYWEGQNASAGVYYYLIRYTSDCEREEQLLKGPVTLIR